MRAALLLLLPALLAAAGCSKNAATGESSFTAFMSPSEEKRVGQEEHPKILKEFGGAYDHNGLAAYVQQIGTRLVAVSEAQDKNYTFTVLNSPIVNAMALPGGYVYVTRGLIALTSSEAELAGVIGHEIGHVIARHTAQRYSRGAATGLLASAVGIFLGSQQVGEFAQYGVQAYLQSYSRDQEFEADTLGVRYLQKAGYDPKAMAGFLAKLQAQSAYEAQLHGASGKEGFDIMQSHPRTSDRVTRAIEEAGGNKEGRTDEAALLARVDGMLYGDDPAQGTVRGRRFSHPGLGISFEVPEGYTLNNGDAQVVAAGPNGAAIAFDMAEAGGTASDYLAQWVKGAAQGRQAITVAGMEASTVGGTVKGQQGEVAARFIAIRGPENRVYRFQFVGPAGSASRQLADSQQVAGSFRRLTAEEAAAIKPLRIAVKPVTDPAAARQEAAAMPVAQPARLFEILNGLAANAAPAAGRSVKFVTE